MTVPEKVDITPEEMESVEKMRARFKNDLPQAMYEDTNLFLRFLKARDFNLSQSEIMLRKHLQWRKAKKVDTIIEEFKPFEVLEKYMPINAFAFDKEDSICYYLPVSKFDVKGIHRSAKPSDIDSYLIRSLELGERAIIERAENRKGKLPGYVLVYDLEDLPFATATDKKGIEDLIRTAKIIQDNYPERLKAVLIINASNLFTIPFAILKKFLAPNVVKKIHVYGADRWREHLLKLIDADKIPAFLGGKKTDPDGNPLCKSIINFAGPVPESYHLKNTKNPLCGDPRSKKLVIPRTSTIEIDLDIVVPGSLIQWEFEAKSKDVAFGLFFKEKSGDDVKVTELVPIIRLECELCSETGVYKCEMPGTYTLVFDNSYSWIRSKEIYYKVSVVNPKEHEVQLER
ncbi:SEC14-like protein 2 isoform X1 [Parasteatoda tepidariorum]|uniref:SEC14-like protein 2 isoform X2 n=1 Tax=Parasteatoda tepidariorum TaxID=114398 RepID=UPI00077FBA5A|nr:SEC14-like protein 2 isoform X1 [Parasteatoda tepidariorum]XP_042905280.1 SEC14-like protein 2 isoform X2 [Parasteatoda tepidariorum]XP_042905281.1 SEC14-like protein 2 isoform X1 [Parasteatoda tepidariorum]XP_042905282.1 SEC14-like protein 2 isoform X1 [Parasteatoda tepidariorum]